MGFSKFNKGSRFEYIDTEGYEYRKLVDLYEQYGKDTTYPIRALYLNDTKFGKSVVAVTDGYFINLPSHTQNDVAEIISDDELVAQINAGEVSIRIHEYFSDKYNKTFYGINWVS